jgi:hypothetical protein
MFESVEYLRLSAAGRLLGVSRVTAWRMGREGKLGPLKGRPVRVQLAEVLKVAGPRTEQQIREAMKRKRQK